MSTSYIHFSSTPDIRVVLTRALQALDDQRTVSPSPAHASSSSKPQNTSSTAAEPEAFVTDARASPVETLSPTEKANADDDAQLLASQRVTLISFANSKDGDPVPYRLIRAACCFLKCRTGKGFQSTTDQAHGPLLQTVLKRSSLQLPTPPARYKVSLSPLRSCPGLTLRRA